MDSTTMFSFLCLAQQALNKIEKHVISIIMTFYKKSRLIKREYISGGGQFIYKKTLKKTMNMDVMYIMGGLNKHFKDF